MDEKQTHDLARIASLTDRTRRRIYEYVAGQRHLVSRDEAARQTHVSRPLAAYHLDRLVADGLLEAQFRRPEGRRGPGAGRPTKLYARPGGALEVSFPRRDYATLARVLLDAVAAAGEAGDGAVAASALKHGQLLGETTGSPADESEAEDRLLHLLRAQGYEPYTDDAGMVWLRNCLFEREVAANTDLVCGANLALVKGLLRHLGEPEERAVLAPGEGRCCVAITPGHDAE